MCLALPEMAGCSTSPVGDPPSRRNWSHSRSRLHRPRPTRLLARMEGERGPHGIADPPSASRQPCAPTGRHEQPATASRPVTERCFDFGRLSYCGGLNTDVPALQCRVDGSPLQMAAVTAPARRRLRVRLWDARWFRRPSWQCLAWRTGPARRSGRRPRRDTNGEGYFVVAADGSVYAFGNAKYRGSRGGQPTDGAVVGIAVNPLSGGYWIATSQGAVYAEGAPNWGSAAGLKLASPIVSIAAWPNGAGYWLAAQNGDVYSYGLGRRLEVSRECPLACRRHRADPSGNGYWLATANGSVIHPGVSRSYGELAAWSHSEPVTAFGSVP